MRTRALQRTWIDGVLYGPPNPIVWLQRWLVRGDQPERYDGIAIIDRTFGGSDDAVFVAWMRDALALIQRVDPRRYRMVSREVRHIVNAHLLAAGAEYERGTRSCRIDFSRYRRRDRPEHEEWYVARCAAVLIHEATHGRIFSAGIPYTRKTRLRVERLCRKQEQYFASRLPCERYDYGKLVPAFDAADWERRRMGFRARWTWFRALLREYRIWP